MTYKTADLALEAGLEVDRKALNPGAPQTMAGARTATNLLGGEPDAAAGLGDDASYGAFSVLYLRKGDIVLTITPPNLKQVAQQQAYQRMTAASGDRESQRKAMEELSATMKNDPSLSGSSQRDPMDGAIDVVHDLSKPQGTEDEAKANAMGLKALEKLGSTQV